MPSLVRDTIYAVTEQTDSGLRLLGTAFACAEQLLLTAGHVAAAVQASSGRRLLYHLASAGIPEPVVVMGADVWQGIDIGTLRAPLSPSGAVRWADQIIHDPGDVNTNGYAHGYEPEIRTLVVRHFRGHIVCARRYASWGQAAPGAGSRSAVPFWAYQLSFACPTGLSGAPLLHPIDNGRQVVVGVIVGNHKSSMLVHESTEIVSAGTVERVEQYAHLHMGEAIATFSLLNPEGDADPDLARKTELRSALLKAAGEAPSHPSGPAGRRRGAMSKRDEGIHAFANSPILRALVELLPGGGALNELMAHRAAEIDRDRLDTLLAEIAAGAKPLTQEIIASEDFIHCFYAAVRVSRLTRQRQKIRFFGRLLAATFDSGTSGSVDRFERFCGILDELTFEEIRLLAIVAKHEKSASTEGNPLQRTATYWNALVADAAASLGVPQASIEPLLTRLARTGLYQPITGAFLDYEGGRGVLTLLYKELAELVA